jgi:hypothetical protein
MKNRVKVDSNSCWNNLKKFWKLFQSQLLIIWSFLLLYVGQVLPYNCRYSKVLYKLAPLSNKVKNGATILSSTDIYSDCSNVAISQGLEAYVDCICAPYEKLNYLTINNGKWSGAEAQW